MTRAGFKTSEIESWEEQVEKILEEANEFVKKVARVLGVEAPLVKHAYIILNKYLERPIFRGLYDHETNIIAVSILFPFRSIEDFERTVRHEITEWLTYFVEGRERLRIIEGHNDPLFRRIYSAVKRHYPNNPRRLAEYVLTLKTKISDTARSFV